MHTFFVHIGKCGGMSIREMLKQKYGADNSYDISDIFTKWNKAKVDTPTAFYGHATYSLSSFLPQPLYIFTMLRNPASRILSYWKHMKREGPKIHTTNAHLLAMDFTDALQHPDFDRLNNGIVKALSIDLSNEYTDLYHKVHDLGMDFTIEHNKFSRHLNNSDVGIDRCYCDSNMLETAKECLSDVRFGFQEKYNEGIHHIFEPLEYMPEIVQVNAAPLTQQIDLTPTQMEIIKETNKYDFELYEYAQTIYSRRIQK